MALVYNDFLNSAKETYKKSRENVLAASQQLHTNQANTLKETYNAQVNEAEKAYEDSYRDNAIQKLVNERQVAENMANMGLTDSGLNRTQQTATQLSYSNNKAQIDRQKQAQVDALAQQLASNLASVEQSRVSSAADINSQYDQLEINKADNDYNTAVTADATKYAAEQEAIAEQEVARLQNEVDMAELELERYKIDTEVKSAQEELRLENAYKIANLQLEAEKLKLEQLKIDNSSGDSSQQRSDIKNLNSYLEDLNLDGDLNTSAELILAYCEKYDVDPETDVTVKQFLKTSGLTLEQLEYFSKYGKTSSNFKDLTDTGDLTGDGKVDLKDLIRRKKNSKE